MKYKFSLLENNIVYDGFHKIELFNFQYEKFNGSQSNIVTRELSRRTSCVGILPYDPKRQEVILIEQIRVGALANNEHPWLLEIIAGIIEPNEDLEQTAKREAKEEADCSINQLIPIYEYYLSPGGSSEKINLYLGITNTDNAGGIHGCDSEDEDIKVHIIPISKAFLMLENCELTNASTIIALQWLKLNIEKI